MTSTKTTHRHGQRLFDRGLFGKRHKAEASRDPFLPQHDAVLDLPELRKVVPEGVVVDLSRAPDEELTAQGRGGGVGGCRGVAVSGGGGDGADDGGGGGSGGLSCRGRGHGNSSGSGSSCTCSAPRARHGGLGVDALAVDVVLPVLCFGFGFGFGFLFFF